MPKCSVAITGVGAATPLGSDFVTFSANLLAGKSAAIAVTDVRAGVEVSLPFCMAADPPVAANWTESAFRALPRSEQFVLWCATSALADAGYLNDRFSLRVGLVLGSGGELLRRWEGDWYAGGREAF